MTDVQPVDLLAAERALRALSLLVFGGSKAGKSWLGYTTPAPRLILDTEAGRSSRFVPKAAKVVRWDPYTHAPPEKARSWNTCVVIVRTVQDLEQVLQHLERGVHPFKSVVLDSLWELQQTYITGTVGAEQMRVQDWGTVLRQLLLVVNKMRDLCVHPTRPIEVFMVTTAERDDGTRITPFLQGQLKSLIAYKFDVVGYIWPYLAPVEGAQTERLILVANDPAVRQQYGLFTPIEGVGEAVGGRLGSVVRPNVKQMLDTIYGTDAAETTAATAAESKES